MTCWGTFTWQDGTQAHALSLINYVQLEFAEARTSQVQQEAADLRTQLAASHSDLEASRKLCEEQKARLEQLEGKPAPHHI